MASRRLHACFPDCANRSCGLGRRLIARDFTRPGRSPTSRYAIVSSTTSTSTRRHSGEACFGGPLERRRGLSVPLKLIRRGCFPGASAVAPSSHESDCTRESASISLSPALPLPSGGGQLHQSWDERDIVETKSCRGRAMVGACGNACLGTLRLEGRRLDDGS